jgi:hypothetical protein
MDWRGSMEYVCTNTWRWSFERMGIFCVMMTVYIEIDSI